MEEELIYVPNVIGEELTSNANGTDMQINTKIDENAKLIYVPNAIDEKLTSNANGTDMQTKIKIDESSKLPVDNVCYTRNLFSIDESNAGSFVGKNINLYLSENSSILNEITIKKNSVTDYDEETKTMDLDIEMPKDNNQINKEIIDHASSSEEDVKNKYMFGNKKTTLLDISYINKEEIQNVKDGIESHADSIYMKENQKLNTIESASMAELNAITTQNFNLINNEFEQNKSNEINNAYNICALKTQFDFDNNIPLFSNTIQLINSTNIDSNLNIYDYNQSNDDLKDGDTSQILYGNINKSETKKSSEDSINILNDIIDVSFTNTESNDICIEKNKNEIQDKSDESDSGLELTEDRFVTPTDSLSSDDINLNSVHHIDDLITKTSNGFAGNTVSDVSHTEESVINEVIYNHHLGVPVPSTTYVPTFNSNISVKAVVAKSSLKRSNVENILNNEVCSKKVKKGISFDKVSIFYFPRTQGFTCIPSQGGSTLGMSWNHIHSKIYSLGEHAAEQRRAHKQFISQQYSNAWTENSNTSSEDSDSDEQMSDSEVDYENCNFLQPIPTRDRRAMLRVAGVRKIDSTEKDECRQIRMSREYCGCSCQTYCDPDTCACSQAGIKCQVDRLNFPCSCTRDGCVNPNGRIEFNPVRVRTHYIHTLMRLELEKKQAQELANMHRDDMSLSPNIELQSCIRANNFVNFHYPNSLQAYYQQQPQQPQYNAAISSSCFTFNYNQFFSASAAAAYQQSTAVNLVPPAVEYHPQPNLYESSLQVLQFCNSNEQFSDVNKKEDCNRTDSTGDQEETIKTFSDLFEDNTENVASDIESANLKSELKVLEEANKEETSNLGEIITKTIVETVTTAV